LSKADDIFWRQFGSILAGLTLFGIVMFFLARIIAGDAFERQSNAPSAVLERIAPVATVRVGDPAATVAPPAPAVAPPETAQVAAAGEGESFYNGGCSACHATGAAGAPKLDDQAAWAPRVEQGVDALVGSVLKGKGAMPPKGASPNLSDSQIRAAVEYMLSQVVGDSGAAAGGASAVAATTQAVEGAAPAAGDMAKATVGTAAAAVEQTTAAVATASGDTAAAGDMAKATVGTAAAVVEQTTAAAVEQTTAAAAGGDEAAGGDAAAGQPGDAVYKRGCMACHATGAANAPKLTDKAAWETRAGSGFATLVQSALKGKGAMPPKGGQAGLGEADIRNAVRYMLEQAGVEAGG
jgi:cytochrome c5